MSDTDPALLLGPVQIRALADELGLRPSKARGQNFVIDPNTVRRIVRLAQVGPEDVVLEVGPGLGSLTLGLVSACAHVTAIEVEPVLARRLPATAREHLGTAAAGRLSVLEADALHPPVPLPGPEPTALVANLPYNVAVPVLLTALGSFPSITSGLVMVQLEVADRLVAAPGSRVYGVPSAKLAWYAQARRIGRVGPNVFWPRPRVDSGLVRFERRQPPDCRTSRDQVFACVDAAFSQRRKALRSSLATWAGGVQAADEVLRRAGVRPSDRGEVLAIEDFARLADARLDLD
ncbi:MAG: 16S rRNA (adenine(1518)-N(6)/adenine(1519)-N(6))-dimethyltransferase RsmA [Actinomycetes bacterium]